MKTLATGSLIAISIAISIAASSCAAHVALDEIPDAKAPLEDRAAAYDRLRPQNAIQQTMGMNGTWAGPRRDLVLNDGTVVQVPRDLAPAVKPGGPTMQHVQRYEDLDAGAGVVYGAAGVLYALGVAGAVGGLAMEATVDDGQAGFSAQEDEAMWVTLGSLGVALGAAIVALPAVWIGMAASDERNAAFAAYDGDLKKRLALVPKKKDLVEKWEDSSSGASGSNIPAPVTDPSDADTRAP